MDTEKLVINAENTPLGRIASYAAKQALLGKAIIIVNCSEAIISGDRQGIISRYQTARARGGSALKGPNIKRSPYMIMKRTIRGMLSYKQGRGLNALKKILCYNDIPAEYQNKNKISLKKEIKTDSMQLKELSKLI